MMYKVFVQTEDGCALLAEVDVDATDMDAMGMLINRYKGEVHHIVSTGEDWSIGVGRTLPGNWKRWGRYFDYNNNITGRARKPFPFVFGKKGSHARLSDDCANDVSKQERDESGRFTEVGW